MKEAIKQTDKQCIFFFCIISSSSFAATNLPEKTISFRDSIVSYYSTTPYITWTLIPANLEQTCEVYWIEKMVRMIDFHAKLCEANNSCKKLYFVVFPTLTIMSRNHNDWIGWIRVEQTTRYRIMEQEDCWLNKGKQEKQSPRA